MNTTKGKIKSVIKTAMNRRKATLLPSLFLGSDFPRAERNDISRVRWLCPRAQQPGVLELMSEA